MAQYKVIQDIEAEDKLLGPLTLKGFIYAIIAVFCAFINFRLIISGLGPLKWLFVLMFALPMILFGVLASPLGRHQPTEVWLLGRIRFLLKPRKRIWSQTGLLHLVTVTAPKKTDKQLTKGLSDTEVKSRLQTLATTLDSRGWAVRNLTIAPGAKPEPEAGSDRLVTPTLMQTEPIVDILPADDILDEQNNPTAQYFANLMEKADDQRKASVANKVNAVRIAGETYVAPPSAVTVVPRADTLELAQSGNDFSVATLSSLANRKGQF
ncbi:PrgI family protein [Candidatus Saccharibacteria bacterium]|nr:PrgI family protein [Candidatus Saccharibacteria bacterium]